MWLTFPSKELETRFWVACAELYFCRLDVASYLLGLLQIRYERGSASLQTWGVLLFVIGTLQVAWAMLQRSSYVRYRQQVTLVQRLLRIVMYWHVASRLGEKEVVHGYQWMEGGKYVQLMRILILIPGTAHLCQHALTYHLSFPTSCVLQILSVGIVMHHTAMPLVNLLQRLDLWGVCYVIRQVFQSGIFHVLMVLCGSTPPELLNASWETSPRMNAHQLVVFSQLIFGLVLPLYICYHMEWSWRRRFVLQQPPGDCVVQGEEPTGRRLIKMLAAVSCQCMLLVSLVAGAWMLGEVITDNVLTVEETSGALSGPGLTGST